jgi:hypothetical protein
VLGFDGSGRTGEGRIPRPRTSLRGQLRFRATFFVLEHFRESHSGRVRERKRRSRRRDFRRRGEGRRAAKINAVVEVQLPHDFQERRDCFQVSLLQRNVGAAQRLGQPGDLEAGVVLRRIEPPLRQGLTDSATICSTL